MARRRAAQALPLIKLSLLCMLVFVLAAGAGDANLTISMPNTRLRTLQSATPAATKICSGTFAPPLAVATCVLSKSTSKNTVGARVADMVVTTLASPRQPPRPPVPCPR